MEQEQRDSSSMVKELSTDELYSRLGKLYRSLADQMSELEGSRFSEYDERAQKYNFTDKSYGLALQASKSIREDILSYTLCYDHLVSKLLIKQRGAELSGVHAVSRELMRRAIRYSTALHRWLRSFINRNSTG